MRRPTNDEREPQRSAKTLALDLQPDPEGLPAGILQADEELAFPPADRVVQPAFGDRALELPDVEPDGPGIQSHLLPIDRQGLAHGALEFQHGLSK
jgi:hypothetical protein